MKTLLVGVFTLLAFCLPALAEAPATISDQEFILQVTTAVEVAQDQNPNVKLLGVGTATLLDSGRESKIRCGRSNPNPKPGECSDAYPIYPEPVALEQLVKQEQTALPDVVKSLETVWVAWRDLNGLNVVFNSPAIGDYELSTVTEVEDDERWSATRTYYASVKIAEQEWVQGPKINKAGFTWLILGKSEMTLNECLKALEGIGAIKDANPMSEDLLERYAEWRKINPEKLSPGQKAMVEQFDQIGNLPNDTLQFIALWPWVNVENLTVRDKVFLMETSKEYTKFLTMALLG